MIERSKGKESSTEREGSRSDNRQFDALTELIKQSCHHQGEQKQRQAGHQARMAACRCSGRGCLRGKARHQRAGQWHEYTENVGLGQLLQEVACRRIPGKEPLQLIIAKGVLQWSKRQRHKKQREARPATERLRVAKDRQQSQTSQSPGQQGESDLCS